MQEALYKRQPFNSVFASTSEWHPNLPAAVGLDPAATSPFRLRRRILLFLLLALLDVFSWPFNCLGAAASGSGAYSSHQKQVMFRKRMCFQCHQPFQCTKGFCYGDFCVKSLVAEKYVSKGCENRSSSNTAYSSRSTSTKPSGSDATSFYSSSSLLGEIDPTGCYKMDVFGVPNTICYCSDMDFCNGKKGVTMSFPFLFSALAMLLVLIM